MGCDGFRGSQVFRDREDAKVRHEVPRRTNAAEINSQDAPVPVRLPAVDLVTVVVGQAGIVDGFDVWIVARELRKSGRGPPLLARPQMERLRPLERQPRLER